MSIYEAVFASRAWRKQLVMPVSRGFVVLLAAIVAIPGCASYKYVGRWETAQYTSTHINRKHAIQVSFPNRSWHVYYSPRDEGYPSALPWKRPDKKNPAADYLKAVVVPLPVVIQLSLAPNPLGWTLERLEKQFAKKQRWEAPENVSRPHIVVRGGRPMLMSVERRAQAKIKALTLVMREPDRFVSFQFFAPVVQGIYDDKLPEFYKVVGSYRRLDGVVEEERKERKSRPPTSQPSTQPSSRPSADPVEPDLPEQLTMNQIRSAMNRLQSERL